MRKDELQYLSDTLLLEELASDPELRKQAGLFEDIGFGSIADGIKQFAKENIRADAPGGYIGSIVSLMAPAVLFRIHPILGIAAAAAHALGFDIVGVVKTILGAFSDKINSGEGVSLSEISAAGREAVSSEVGDASETDDMLQPIRAALEAQAIGRGKLPKTPWGYSKGAPLLQRIFGNLSRARGKWLVGGIIVWLLKTLLVGAGLVAGAGLVKKLVMPTKEKATVTAPAAPGATPSAPRDVRPSKPADPFEASGSGEQHFANDANAIWIVPLLGGNVERTLVAWAVDVYPKLSGNELVIRMSPAFKRAANKLKRNFNPSNPGSLIMPIGLHSRKQVVDLFARDVKKLLKE